VNIIVIIYKNTHALYTRNFINISSIHNICI